MYSCSKSITKYTCKQSMLLVMTIYQMPSWGETSQVFFMVSHQPALTYLFLYQPISSTSCSQGAPVSVETSYFPLDNDTTSINPSPLYPNCRAEEWNFLWRGFNYSPLSNIENQTIQLIASLTLCASLHDLSGYGSGICKFYLFCSIFTIPETDHLLASFKLLHSFTLWIATDPSMLNPRLAASV